jgi:hypothetical protein
MRPRIVTRINLSYYPCTSLWSEGRWTMMGILVVGRHGAGSGASAHGSTAHAGWMRRVLGALFGRR